MGEGAPVRWVIKRKVPFRRPAGSSRPRADWAVFRSRTRTALSSRDSGFPRANAVEMRVDFSERDSRCDGDFSRFANPYFENGSRLASFVRKRSAVSPVPIFALGATTTLMTSEGGWFIAD